MAKLSLVYIAKLITRVDELFVSVLVLLITLFATATKMKAYVFVDTLKELIKFSYPISDDYLLLKVCMWHNMKVHFLESSAALEMLTEIYTSLIK